MDKASVCTGCRIAITVKSSGRKRIYCTPSCRGKFRKNQDIVKLKRLQNIPITPEELAMSLRMKF